MRAHYPVVVIGGGQAGLSMSFVLKKRGIGHAVLEKHRIANAWRTQRWDSFCLVTPNWQCRLPGHPYAGADPHGFMVKSEIIRYIEDYAAAFEPPLHEGVSVTSLQRDAAGIFQMKTTAGDISAGQVVVAIGGYHVPVIPRLAERLPGRIVQLHSSEYRSARELPVGEVMVVGSGQSGCQIAEDLHLAGRRVHLCVGSAPRTARWYRGKDVVEWLDRMGHYDLPVHQHPLRERVRAKANHYVTGRDGGRDIDLRKLALEGMRLYGRLRNVRGCVLELGADLRRNLDQADASAASIKASIDKYIAATGIDAPAEAPYRPVWEPPPQEPLELDCDTSRLSAVIWSTGFRSDWSWIEIPVFDGRGYPGHKRGVTSVPGLYFLGLPWLYTWGSGRFSGVARDAEFIAEQIDPSVLTASTGMPERQQSWSRALPP
jgi:putative flavoprotein involved in K+ transport